MNTFSFLSIRLSVEVHASCGCGYVYVYGVYYFYDDVNDDDPTLFAADDIKSATLYVRMYGHTDTSHYLLCL